MKEIASPPGYKCLTSGVRQGATAGDPESTTTGPAGSAVAPASNLRRRMSIRATGVRPRRSTSSVTQSGGAGGGLSSPAVSGGAAQIQLLSIPQLDAIQRTLRILDVRLQHVQSNARDDERTRSDIEHIRRLMSENQNALATVITVLSSIQEEVRRLSITVHKQQTSVLQIQPPPSGSGAGAGSKTVSAVKDSHRQRGALWARARAAVDKTAAVDSHRQRGSISHVPAPLTSATTSTSTSKATASGPTPASASTSGQPSTTVVLGSGVESSPL